MEEISGSLLTLSCQRHCTSVNALMYQPFRMMGLICCDVVLLFALFFGFPRSISAILKPYICSEQMQSTPCLALYRACKWKEQIADILSADPSLCSKYAMQGVSPMDLNSHFWPKPQAGLQNQLRLVPMALQAWKSKLSSRGNIGCFWRVKRSLTSW